jgi:hypothetical protein
MSLPHGCEGDQQTDSHRSSAKSAEAALAVASMPHLIEILPSGSAIGTQRLSTTAAS